MYLSKLQSVFVITTHCLACYLDGRWYVERGRREAAKLAQVLLALDSSDYHLLIIFCQRKTPWCWIKCFWPNWPTICFWSQSLSWILKLLNGHLRMGIFIWLICWADQGKSASFPLILLIKISKKGCNVYEWQALLKLMLFQRGVGSA